MAQFQSQTISDDLLSNEIFMETFALTSEYPVASCLAPVIWDRPAIDVAGPESENYIQYIENEVDGRFIPVLADPPGIPINPFLGKPFPLLYGTGAKISRLLKPGRSAGERYEL